jgi:uncharacterized protein (TIGR02118 family)
MPTKISVIYDNPTDLDEFEAGYIELVPLAKTMPGLQRLETAKVWPKEDGSPTPAYRTVDLYFVDYDAAVAAIKSPEAGAFVPHLRGLASGGVRILFQDVQES